MNTKKSPLGRPRQPREKLRSERVVTFLTKAEYAQFLEQVESCKQSLSATAHDLLIQSLGSE